MMDLTSIGTTHTGEPFSWTAEDAMMYALSVGAGAGGGESRGMPFTTEGFGGQAQEVLPSFAVILTLKSGASAIRLAGDFPLSSIIHAGQRVVTKRPIPVSGTAVGTSEVLAIHDTGKHALVTSGTTLTDVATGEVLARTETTALILRAGGFDGPKAPIPPQIPEREPDGETTEATLPQQALLYRLNGDMNPLHASIEAAERAGFPAPILHGLCTYGFAGRALLAGPLERDVSRFTSFESRFKSPVFPGESLTTRWWDEGDHILFQTLVEDRVVLDAGVLTVG